MIEGGHCPATRSAMDARPRAHEPAGSGTERRVPSGFQAASLVIDVAGTRGRDAVAVVALSRVPECGRLKGLSDCRRLPARFASGDSQQRCRQFGRLDRLVVKADIRKVSRDQVLLVA